MRELQFYGIDRGIFSTWSRKRASGWLVILILAIGMVTPEQVAGQEFSGTPTSGSVPLDVQFTDESTGTPTGWAWYFGDEDWTAKTWTEMNSSAPWTARQYHASVVLQDGSILLMGGLVGTLSNDVWRSEDQGATWTEVTDSAEWTERLFHTSVVLPDGSIVLMGGSDGSLRNDVWRSEDQGATWTEVTAAAEWTAREHHTSVVLPDGSIVLMGGDDGSRKNDVWRSEDQGATWTEVTAAAEWTAVRRHTSVVLPDGSIVLMGGYAGGRRNNVWRSQDQGATWTEVTAAAEWTKRMDHTSVVLPDGSIVLMGGDDGLGSRRNDVWRSEDHGATWTQMMDSAEWTERSFHTSVVLPDGSIVLMGGNDSSLKNDVWRMETATSEMQNPEHTYTEAGTYDVSLQSYNAEDFGNIQKSEYIEITEPPLFCGGEGTEADPYLICTADQLNNIREDLTAHYKLDNDIDLDVAPYNEGEGWDPIGDSDNPFEGVFNGDEHVISDLYINTGSSYVGMFGYSNNAFIEKIGVIDISIKGNEHVGVIIGSAVESEILLSFSSGEIIGKKYVGGIAGSFSGKISECYSTTYVRGILLIAQYHGGLIGYLNSSSTVDDSHSSGNVVTAGTDVGGFVGYKKGGNINNSYASGTVVGNGGITGGFVGQQGIINSTGNGGEIHNSFSSGTVNDSNGNFVGGFAGLIGSGLVKNSYALGDVGGSSRIGGFAGFVSGAIENVYSIGTVSGSSNLGGLIGQINDASVTNSFYDTQTSGQSDTGKGTPKTTAEMKQISTFSADWDIASTITERNDGYPFLGWQDDSEEAIWLITEAEPLFCGGEGTEAEPYLICDADQLNNVREDLTAHYKLANDINMDVAPYNEGEGWEPIGVYLGWEDSENEPFNGSLDGNEKTIFNLFMYNTDITSRKVIALFELADGAEFKDLTVENVDITSGFHAGALIGIAFNTELTNISSSGQIVGWTRVGGIVGEIYDSVIENSNSSCSIVTDSVGGGLVGQINDTKVSNSFATGSVSGIGDYEMGGLLGDASGTSTVSNCYATGDVTTVSNEAGGLIGYVNYDVKIINSYATGDVNGGSNSDDVGGLVGYFRGDEILNAYATGNVTGNKSVGGLAGHLRGASVSLKNTYSVGTVDGAENVGGLVGEFESGTITHSFYDSQTSGQSDTGKGTPKTTAEMKQQSTFTTPGSDWDFTNLWDIESGDYISYPYFGNSEEAPEQDPPPGLTRVGGFAENPRLIAAAGKKTAVTTSHILFGDDGEVTITRKPYRGRLLLDGTEVENGDEVLKTEVEGNELEFEHEGDRTESEYRYTDFLYATSAEERTLPVDLAGRGIEYLAPEGWFLFSSPETNQTVGDLLRNMRTDGYPGSTNPGASFPTVYTLDQEAYEWAPVTDSDQKLVPGTALLVFVFEEDTPKNPMLYSGGPWSPLDGSFTYDDLLGYDPDQGSGGNSFYLIGNPHPVPINICRMLREGSNIATSLYFWNPAENDGNGGYVNYSCDIPAKTQSITDMYERPSREFHLPAFAGIWVRTTAENPELAITENDYLISTRKEVEELPEPLTFELTHSDQDYVNRVHILLQDDAETGLDRIDAIKMSSAGLAENYLSFYALDEENRKFALRSLPAYLEEPVNIPLVVETTVSGDYTLRWSPPSEEHGLVYRLADRVTGAEYNLGSEGELSLTIPEAGEGAINRFTVTISTEGFISEPELPTSIALKQNYPNPFNPTTVIEYQLPQSAQVRLQVYDMSGRQVAELVNDQVSAGTHTISFDASSLSSGVYMYRLQAGSTMLTRKLTVVK